MAGKTNKTTKYIVLAVIVIVAIVVLYKLFGPEPDKYNTQRYRNQLNWLSTNPEQIAFIQDKADKNGVSFQEQAQADARWYIDKKQQT